MKTNSSAKKRFKVTGTGKILHKQAGKRHNLNKKSQKRIRNLRKAAVLADGNTASVLKFKMPYNNVCIRNFWRLMPWRKKYSLIFKGRIR